MPLAARNFPSAVLRRESDASNVRLTERELLSSGATSAGEIITRKAYLTFYTPINPRVEVEADKAFIAGRTKCDVQVRTFKCMAHESCEQELAVCANWLAKVLAVDDDAALGAAAGVSFVK